MSDTDKLGTCDNSDYAHTKNGRSGFHRCVNWREQPAVEPTQRKYTFDDYCEGCAQESECSKRGQCLAVEPAQGEKK